MKKSITYKKMVAEGRDPKTIVKMVYPKVKEDTKQFEELVLQTVYEIQYSHS